MNNTGNSLSGVPTAKRYMEAPTRDGLSQQIVTVGTHDDRIAFMTADNDGNWGVFTSAKDAMTISIPANDLLCGCYEIRARAENGRGVAVVSELGPEGDSESDAFEVTEYSPDTDVALTPDTPYRIVALQQFMKGIVFLLQDGNGDLLLLELSPKASHTMDIIELMEATAHPERHAFQIVSDGVFLIPKVVRRSR